MTAFAEQPRYPLPECRSGSQIRAERASDVVARERCWMPALAKTAICAPASASRWTRARRRPCPLVVRPGRPALNGGHDQRARGAMHGGHRWRTTRGPRPFGGRASIAQALAGAHMAGFRQSRHPAALHAQRRRMRVRTDRERSGISEEGNGVVSAKQSWARPVLTANGVSAAAALSANRRSRMREPA